MKKQILLFIPVSFAIFLISYLTGCSCECEVQCQEAGGDYSYKMVEMRRSECESLNNKDKKAENCNYRCADR